MINKINEFDFDTRKLKRTKSYSKSLKENIETMMGGLQYFCMNCRMCSIGCELVQYENESHDPHIFSNMGSSKYMIVIDNQNMEECRSGVLLNSAIYDGFRNEIKRHGLYDTDFYVSSIVKCYNGSKKEIKVCSTLFLKNEIKILKPKVIIAMGESVFRFFCPSEKQDIKYGKIINSDYGKVYAVDFGGKLFNKQIELLSKLINKIES